MLRAKWAGVPQLSTLHNCSSDVSVDYEGESLREI